MFDYRSDRSEAGRSFTNAKSTRKVDHRMKYMIKALGLTIFVALGLMAISASAAQALTLKVNGAAKAEEKFSGTFNGGFLLVQDLSLEIKCSGGTVGVTLQSSGGNVKGEGTASFTGCTVVGAEETCTVNSPGASVGLISTKDRASSKCLAPTLFSR